MKKKTKSIAMSFYCDEGSTFVRLVDGMGVISQNERDGNHQHILHTQRHRHVQKS
jgi:hypothetical protein